MGITGFWTTPGTPWEPKMQWRWRVSIGGLGMQDGGNDRGLKDSDVVGLNGPLAWYAKTIDKPKMTFGTANEGLANVGQMTNDMFVAGSPKWGPVSMTLVDPTEPNATRKLLRWVRRSGYMDKEAAVYNFEQRGVTHGNFSAAEFKASIGEVKIEQLDPGGGTQHADEGGGVTALETWQLMDPWVQEIDFGSLDYSSDNPVEIKITFGYKYATCIQHGTAGFNDGADGPWYRGLFGENIVSPERTFLYFRDSDARPTVGGDDDDDNGATDDAPLE